MMRTLLLLALLIVTSISASEQLYEARSSDMGITDFDVVITEIQRKPRFSVLSIPGLHDRSAAASRWIMCVYTDLAIKRGYKYWAVLYFTPPKEEVILGFPEHEGEDLTNIFGEVYMKEGMVLGSVSVDIYRKFFGKLCGISDPDTQ